MLQAPDAGFISTENGGIHITSLVEIDTILSEME